MHNYQKECCRTLDNKSLKGKSKVNQVEGKVKGQTEQMHNYQCCPEYAEPLMIDLFDGEEDVSRGTKNCQRLQDKSDLERENIF